MAEIVLTPTRVKRGEYLTLTFSSDIPSGTRFEAGIVNVGGFTSVIDARAFTWMVGEDVPLGSNTVYVYVEGYTPTYFPIEVYEEPTEITPTPTPPTQQQPTQQIDLNTILTLMLPIILISTMLSLVASIMQ